MKLTVICALLAICGCVDHPDGWEYNVYAPANATPERLMEIARLLETNGYKRIRMTEVDFGRVVLISATKSEGGRHAN